MDDDAIRDLLAEQTAYYRERAREYDTTSRPPGDPFASITQDAMIALRRLGPVDLAIELGAGTGAFTRVLATIAGEVVALDSSPEMLEVNRAKVTALNIERVVGDVFDWQPVRPAQLVVFGFLLSHIPATRFDSFWEAVGRMLTPGGRVFVMDETPHGLWREKEAPAEDRGVIYRTLSDGRRFRIVKVFWEPADLEQRLAALGWLARLERGDPFYWGEISQMA